MYKNRATLIFNDWVQGSNPRAFKRDSQTIVRYTTLSMFSFLLDSSLPWQMYFQDPPAKKRGHHVLAMTPQTVLSL